MSNNIWRRYFKTPFRNDYNVCIVDFNGNMVADFPEDLTTQACDKIISCLNTESILGYGNMFKPSDDYLEVLVGGETLLNIRGWGYLTGNGSLRLPSDKAIDVQKSLCMFICEQLNSKKLCQTPSS